MSSYPGITSIGIPTRRRPQCLQKCLASFLNNLAYYQREATIWVIDDAHDEASQKATRRVIEKWDADIRYVNRNMRARIAKILAARCGIPESVTHFALLGSEVIPDSYGASRNTLLLLTAGELTLQADDDTQCSTASIPNRLKSLRISDLSDPNSYHFFENQEEAFEAVKFKQTGILALHEKWLGSHTRKHAASIPKANFAELDPSLLARFFHPDSTVSMSFLGTIDSTVSVF